MAAHHSLGQAAAGSDGPVLDLGWFFPRRMKGNQRELLEVRASCVVPKATSVEASDRIRADGAEDLRSCSDAQVEPEPWLLRENVWIVFDRLLLHVANVSKVLRARFYIGELLGFEGEDTSCGLPMESF
jgi:hypothetical protein